MTNGRNLFESGWWFQPSWTIIYSQNENPPQVGVKIKNFWNHQVAIVWCVNEICWTTACANKWEYENTSLDQSTFDGNLHVQDHLETNQTKKQNKKHLTNKQTQKQTKPNQTKANQTQANQTKPKPAKPNQTHTQSKQASKQASKQTNKQTNKPIKQTNQTNKSNKQKNKQIKKNK